MKSNKKVFLLKYSTLSTKISLNFSSDVTSVCKKNNYSFWALKNTNHTNIGSKSFINKKRDTSSIGNSKNVNYFNCIPNVLKKNTSMGEDIFINFNCKTNKNRDTSSAEIKT